MHTEHSSAAIKQPMIMPIAVELRVVTHLSHEPAGRIDNGRTQLTSTYTVPCRSVPKQCPLVFCGVQTPSQHVFVGGSTASVSQVSVQPPTQLNSATSVSFSQRL